MSFQPEAALVDDFAAFDHPGAGFPAELLDVRREGRGCAIIKAGVPAAAAADEAAAAGADSVPAELEAPAEAVAVEVVDDGDALPADLDFIPGDLE